MPNLSKKSHNPISPLDEHIPLETFQSPLAFELLVAFSFVQSISVMIDALDGLMYRCQFKRDRTGVFIGELQSTNSAHYSKDDYSGRQSVARRVEKISVIEKKGQ